MKQILVILAFLVGVTCSLQAQNKPSNSENAQTVSAQQTKKEASTAQTAQTSEVMVVSATNVTTAEVDSMIQAKVDKLVNKKVDKEMRKWKQRYGIGHDDFPFKIMKEAKVASIILTILLFCFPLILVGLILYFRYKNKKAKYEVMKQALIHGKNLPPEFNTVIRPTAPVTGSSNDYLWRKGVKTFFLGFGLALFLGILTEKSLASIGLLIMCIGAGQIILGWFPSASQVKSSFYRNKKEEAFWNEQANTRYQEPTPQTEARETKQYEPSAYAPGNEKATQEKMNEAAGAETTRIQTKEETTGETKATTTEEQSRPSDEENVPSKED